MMGFVFILLIHDTRATAENYHEDRDGRYTKRRWSHFTFETAFCFSFALIWWSTTFHQTSTP